MRSPVRYLLASLAALLLLAAPLTGIVLGQPSADTLPADSPPRVALDRLADGLRSRRRRAGGDRGTDDRRCAEIRRTSPG